MTPLPFTPCDEPPVASPEPIADMEPRVVRLRAADGITRSAADVLAADTPAALRACASDLRLWAQDLDGIAEAEEGVEP